MFTYSWAFGRLPGTVGKIPRFIRARISESDMRRSAFPRLARALAIVFVAAVILAGCSSEPTATRDTQAPELATGLTASTVQPHLGGPDSIYATGTYKYGADYFLSYASTGWFARGCPTSSITACTTPWTSVIAQQLDANRWQYFARIQFDCTNNKRNTYQVRVDFSAFGQPGQTLYKVTKKCGTNPGPPV